MKATIKNNVIEGTPVELAQFFKEYEQTTMKTAISSVLKDLHNKEVVSAPVKKKSVKSRKFKQWTNKEIQFLRNNSERKPSAIARDLGRTTAAIAVKKSQINKQDSQKVNYSW